VAAARRGVGSGDTSQATILDDLLDDAVLGHETVGDAPAFLTTDLETAPQRRRADVDTTPQRLRANVDNAATATRPLDRVIDAPPVAAPVVAPDTAAKTAAPQAPQVPTAPREVPAAPPSTERSAWLVPLMVLIVGSFMSVLDSSIVNVAIPKIQLELGATAQSVAWVVTGYSLALGVIVPVSGWLGLRIGQTNLYIACIAGFAGASALCGLAWNLDSLIAFRILQAIPGGILPVITLTMLYQIVPRDKIGAAMGMYGLGVIVAPAIGPTLGGLLVDSINWRVIFFVNVPIGILGAAAAIAVFPRLRPTSWPKLDLWGFITAGYGLFALLLAFSEGEDWGWTGYRVLILLASGLLSLALFVVIELEVDHPLIDLRILRTWSYSLSLILLAITMTALFTGLYFLPQFLQNVQGLTALDAGLTLLPSALVMTVLMPVAGRLYDAIGPRYPVVIGLLIIAFGSYLLAEMTSGTPRGDIILWTSVRNIGIGLAMMPMMTAGVSALTPALTSAGSAMNNVVQRVVGSVAVALFGAINIGAAAQITTDWGSLVQTGPQALPQLNQLQSQGPLGIYSVYQQLESAATTVTYANGFFISSMLCIVGAVLALMMRSGKAKSTGGATVHVEV
jgi:EmrB/QacA subfamily drug resistance transporter